MSVAPLFSSLVKRDPSLADKPSGWMAPSLRKRPGPMNYKLISQHLSDLLGRKNISMENRLNWVLLILAFISVLATLNLFVHNSAHAQGSKPGASKDWP